MIRRLFVCCSALGAISVLWPWTVRAQCTGYSITGTSVNLLSPTQAAAQGTLAVTVNLAPAAYQNYTPRFSDGSHTLTVGGGTWLQTFYKSYNVTSLSAQFAVGNGPRQGWFPVTSMSGTQATYIDPSWAGNVVHFYMTGTAPAGSAQDVITVTVTNQAPGIYYNDGVWTNAYYQLVSTFGGGSMMNNCSECQGGETQPCLQATHTPLFDSTITNPRTGETYTISNASAGNVAKATESVSGTAYTPFVSVLPGDSPTGSTTNKIYCTMFGWVMSQQWNPGIPDLEMAVTAEEIIPNTCTLVLRFFQQGDDWGINCNVAWKKPPATADRCSVASQIPDFNPAAQWDEQNCKVPGNCSTSDMPPPNGTNASYPKYWYHASWGVRFPPGAPSPDPPILNGGAHNWTFPIYLAEGYVPAGPNQDWWILDLLNLAIPKATGLPIDCTYRDHGTRPIPNPF